MYEVPMKVIEELSKHNYNTAELCSAELAREGILWLTEHDYNVSLSILKNGHSVVTLVREQGGQYYAVNRSFYSYDYCECILKAMEWVITLLPPEKK